MCVCVFEATKRRLRPIPELETGGRVPRLARTDWIQGHPQHLLQGRDGTGVGHRFMPLPSGND